MSEIESLYRNLQRIRVYRLACHELALLSGAYTNSATQRQRNLVLQTATNTIVEMENSIKRQIHQLIHT